MSEYSEASVETYSSASATAIAERAGIGDAIDSSSASAMAGVGALTTAFFSQVETSRQTLEALASHRSGESALARIAGTPLTCEIAATRAVLDVLARPEMRLLSAAVHAEGSSLASADVALRRLEAAGSGLTVHAVERATREAASLRQEIRRSVGAGTARLVRAEASVLHDAVADTLAHMGYRLTSPRRKSRAESLVVRAESGRGTSIFVEIEPARGRIAADLSGFRGTDCVKERDRFLSGLARRGVKVRLMGRQLHGSVEGGPLARELAPYFDQSATRSHGSTTSPARAGQRKGGRS